MEPSTPTRSDLAPTTSEQRSYGALQRDLRQSIRALRRRPAHTAVAALTMALGIGATTVLFSIVNGVLLAPLPWPDAEELVVLSESREGGTNRVSGVMTNATYLAWEEQTEAVEGLAAWSATRRTLGEGEPERIQLAAVTPGLFPLLGIPPKIGRTFEPAESEERLLVLSDGLWRERFEGSEDVLGRLVRLDQEAYRVVGVMPPGFAFPDRDTRAWEPFHVPPAVVREGGGGSLSMFAALARLRDGVTPVQAAAEGEVRALGAPDPGMVVMAVFGSDGPVRISAVPWLDDLTSEVRPAILLLMAAVSLLLLTATASVASLQLAAASARRRELAVRSALGARGGQLARLLLFESGALGLLGGVLGLALAAAILRSAPRLLPDTFPRLERVSIDGGVLLFALSVTVLSAVLFGLAPLWHARRVDLRSALGSAGAAGESGNRSLLSPRALIMVGQVAIASVLLIGASLLGRSFVSLLGTDLGYDTGNVLTARLVMPEHAIAETERTEILEQAVGRLRSIEGVSAVAVANTLPLTRGEALMSFKWPTETDPEAMAQATVRTVSPGYVEALGLRLIAGRGLTNGDTETSQPVVLVNRAFAERYLGDEPLGVDLPLRPAEGRPGYRVVGVVDDIKQRGATDDREMPEITYPYRQRAGGYASSSAYVVARTSGDPLDLVPTLRAIVRDQDEAALVEEVSTMADRYWSTLAQPRLNALLLAGFALFALVIAGAGLFGVLSYGVTQRSREIGVRGALGATRGDIVRLVIAQGLRIVVPGLVIGLVASFWLVQMLSSLLYGTGPRDPTSFVVVPLILLGVALLAFAIPARRAAGLDAHTVLRSS